LSYSRLIEPAPDTFGGGTRMARIPSADGSAMGMPILAQAMTIEEMAEGVKLISDCEEQTIQKGRP
jgi:hypothetical protein